jgi:hypothetical protein
MGIRLVGAALSANWVHVSERARLVLAQMCYVAKDVSSNGHAPGTYWGGHDTFIISVLGQDPGALSDTELSTAQRKIKRAIQELKEAGAVTLQCPASRGRHAIYRVHPDRIEKG